MLTRLPHPNTSKHNYFSLSSVNLTADAPVGFSTEQELSNHSTGGDSNVNTNTDAYFSPDETTQMRVMNDKLNSTYLPMIAESYSKIGKLQI